MALTTDQVWRAVERASDAVLGHATPDGAPRTSGVVYRAHGRRLYVAVDATSWKARHIARDARVSVTVLVRRGGLFALMFPIPPATATFHGTAVVRAPDDPAMADRLDALGPLLPPHDRSGLAVLEITPEGDFLTYGIGVPLMRMRVPEEARGKVAVR